MTVWQPLLAQTESAAEQLTISGAVLMTLSIGMVLALSGYCLWRILSEKRPEEHHHTPLDIDTHDVER